MTLIGEGKFVYRVNRNCFQLPDGYAFRDVAGVAVDSRDNVFVFDRGTHPVTVFDKAGNFLRSFGHGLFTGAHAIACGPDDTVYCTDALGHCVRKFTGTGTLLMTLGVPGQSAAAYSGLPFNRCTHTAISPEGDIYVSDGYGNARIHKYSPDGDYLFAWGGPGIGPGQFTQPHNIVCDDAGLVYVADRESHCIQIFDGRGKYQGQWGNVFRPSGLFMTRGACPVCYVTEMAPHLTGNPGCPNVGPRVSVLNGDGGVEARLGRADSLGLEDDQYLAPHGIAVDSRGDIYVAELATTNWPRLFPGKPLPDGYNAIRKLERITVT